MPASPSEPRNAQLTYKQAGVDIDAGSEVVRRIADAVASTRRAEQISRLGGFAGLFAMPGGMREPVLVSCTDSVGSKVLVAIGMGRHDTIGIDAVAMNVNDLLVTGARTLFVLDYIGISRVDPDVVEQLVVGVADGCRQAGCALLGGETAELPDLYGEGHYDLAAFAVGVVERDAIVSREHVREGDAVLGLPSSGLHSNGYSLARRALLAPEHAGLALDDPLPGGAGETVGEAMLEPTVIYEPAFAAVRDLEGAPLHGAAHITGGGLVDNPPRTIPDDRAVELDLRAVPMPAVIAAIAGQGVPREELLRTFNCGLGMLLYVAADRVAQVRAKLEASGQPALEIGRVVDRGGSDDPQVRFVDR